MKKALLFFALLLYFGHTVFAYDFSAVAPTGQTLYYNVLSGGMAEVTYQQQDPPRYLNLSGSLVIPASVTYGGTSYSVVAIGDQAFSGCSGLTSVTIGNSITSIGDNAFASCISLTSVSIPNSVISIGPHAFSNCSLLSVSIPNSVTSIGVGAFSSCSGLTSVTIPNSVTSIGDLAFSHCSGLTSVSIPNSVTSIGNSAFSSCSGLTSVSIPNSVTSIGNSAFSYCSGMTSVSIPNSVTSIGNYAFKYCSGLTSVSIPNSVTSIGEGVFSDCSGLISITIPDSVTSIGYKAFANCISLTSVTIPNSVTSIGNYAFYYCSGLTSITIGNSVTSIGQGAFYFCSGMNEITSLAIAAPTLEFYAFDGVTNTIPVIIPCGSMALYQSRWNYFSNFIGQNGLHIDIQTADIMLGSATITMQPSCDSIAVIEATANYGYHFTQWNDGDTNNPRTITLTQDTIFTAQFAKNTYTITAISADTIRGSVIGSTSIEYLDSVTIMANPNYGYHFTAWNDGNTDNPRIIVATRDSIFTATFDYNQYTITLNVDTNIHGSVIGSGSYNYLSEQTITATVNYGYHFTAWSDGDTNNPRTITLTQDTIFTALFAKNIYTITAISADTIKGSVNGSTSIEYLDSVTIMANPNYGYHFTAWNDGNTDNPRTIVATRDSVFTASFVYNQYTITLNVDSDIHGSVVGDGTYNYMSEQTIIATANYGYHFTAWSDGDTNNPRTITLTQDTGFTALFAKNQYTLTLQSDDVAHGSVIGGGVFDYLDTVAIEATAVEHYHFVLWNDGNTDNPRQYVLIGNDTLIAIFAIDTHHVSVESCNIAFGSVEGSGDFEYGTPATVTATAYSGYQFVRWSNGDTHNPYTFAVLQDTTLVAIFEAETQGIDDVIANAVNVYTLGGQIVVETNLKEEIVIYDIVGRKVDGGRKTRFDVPASGVYLVKIGTMPTQKVVVVK